MDPSSIFFWIGAIAVLLVVSAFFAGSETALTAVSRGKMHQLEKEGSRVAENEHVVSVAKIEESEEADIELEGGDEIAPEEGATVGESELDKPVDPEPHE